MAASITPAQLRDRLRSGGEIAIVDAREEGSFHNRLNGRHEAISRCRL